MQSGNVNPQQETCADVLNLDSRQHKQIQTTQQQPLFEDIKQT